MIHLRFKMDNPRADQDCFDNIYHVAGDITKHKSWEFEILHVPHDLLIIDIKIQFTGKDHAGPILEIGLFGYVMYLQIYDIRHWDYKNNKWQE